MELVQLETGTAYLKAGFQGFNKSGKTFTAVELAIGVRKHFGLEGPIAFDDTEASAQYVAPRIKKFTGKDLLGIQSRSLGDAAQFLRDCVKQGVSVAIVDSVTHLWRELCDSYLKQINEKRAKLNPPKPPRTRLEFQDWGPIKEKWNVFSNLYLTLPIHVIICGRAGYEYAFEEREDGEGKDLVKTGVKMKTEGEFGFEPSLLVQMDRIQTDGDGKLTPAITHRATVIGDRFHVMDGQTCDNPTFEFFKPYIDCLTPGGLATVDLTRQTDMGIAASGDDAHSQEKKDRAIAWEEIGAAFTMAIPGKGAIEQKAKAQALLQVFGTASPTAIADMPSVKLRDGLKVLREVAIPAAVEEIKAQEEKDRKPAKTEKAGAK